MTRKFRRATCLPILAFLFLVGTSDARDSVRHLGAEVARDYLNRLEEMTTSGFPITGMYSLLAFLPGSKAASAHTLIETIKSVVWNECRAALPEASPPVVDLVTKVTLGYSLELGLGKNEFLRSVRGVRNRILEWRQRPPELNCARALSIR